MRPILLLLALVACAAPRELTDEQKKELLTEVRARIARMPDELKLSQDQYRATRPIVAEMREGVLKAMLKARESGRSLSTGLALKRDLKKVRSDTEAKLAPILTEEQMKAVQRCFDDIRTIVKKAA
jgi:hypothetical protein